MQLTAYTKEQWVSGRVRLDEARIVSFHPMEGWRLLNFWDHGHFMGFLQSLQQKGYRFQ
ncbi:hypothetical protein [Flavonifractor sp. An112]|uniref:hypothetical protein n=1 Tax=Flavonifractor sp. An112 TaxID=1965544 RepID=UPI00130215DA|nr:hypothetical protein [Flavonifractor sp. An112]